MILGAVPVLLPDTPERALSRQPDFTPLCRGPGSLPRAVNNIATQALVAAMAGRKNIVDEQSARAAVTEVTTD